VIAVAHHQPMPIRIEMIGVGVDIGRDLGL
jgi:hypothetical protein